MSTCLLVVDFGAAIGAVPREKAKQVLDIRIVNCGGMRDLMSEMEATFLTSSLGLFRREKDFGLGKPRARVHMSRAYRKEDFMRAAFDRSHILHVIGHAGPGGLDVGVSRTKVDPGELQGEARRRRSAPAIVVATGCKMYSPEWREGFKKAGAKILIGSPDDVAPSDLTSFDMAFYSALLAQIYRGRGLEARVRLAFKLASDHYRAIHAPSAPPARFKLAEL